MKRQWKLWLFASLGLNLSLAAWLARPVTSSPPAALRPPAEGFDARRALRFSSNSVLREASTSLPPFRWSEIESTDYRQYVANLRALGCPEETIRDLVIGDLNQLYATRRAEILKAPERAYWKKPDYHNPGPTQTKELMTLERERSDTLQKLLGVREGPQALIDLVFLQLQGIEELLMFLPAERRAAALQALSAADIDQIEARLRAGNRGGDPRNGLFREHVKVLATVLSPSELEEFRLRESPEAQWLAGETRYFECSKDEFKTWVALLERRPRPGNENQEERKAAALAKLQASLGEDRVREFGRVSEPAYLNARLAAETGGLASDLADRVGQLMSDVQASANQLAAVAGVAVDERRRSLETLQRSTEATLNEQFGEQGALVARRQLRRIIGTSIALLRP